MIPYILAENTSIDRKDAFKLSREMMNGNKWNTFLLELSFLPINILSMLSFGLFGFIYVNPIIGVTRSELYFKLREEARLKEIEGSKLLKDDYLLVKPEVYKDEDLKVYLSEYYILPEVRIVDSFQLNYDKDYSVVSIIYIFFSMALIGWLWEVFLYLFKTGGFVNRGTLLGPWLPIYGFGSIFALNITKVI